jgi:dTDP-4-amino-4,6-dideoxygalactose transaminase
MPFQEIRMVDLQGQYENIKSEIDTAIAEVINSTAFIKGPQLLSFQQDLANYLQVPKLTGCANGTDALQIALMALDLKPGDEVITTPFTFIATVEVICLLGLVPVFADVDPSTFNIDPEELKKKITDKTKAIIPVHLFGQCADLDSILEIAEDHNLFVIEDTAQALGASYNFKNGVTKKAGTIGIIGCTSFFPSKNLGAYGDAGAIFTSDVELGDKIAAIVNHGMKKKYHYEYIGVNSRLDTLQAAILQVKLKYLDQYNNARQKAAAYYDKALSNTKNITIPKRSENSGHIFHQYTLKVKNGMRDDLQKFLVSKNIPSMIYYPVGLHMQPAYRGLGYKENDFPVCEDLCKKVLSLPMHTELDESQLSYITESVNQFFN